MIPEENILDQHGNFNYENKYVPKIQPIYNDSIFDEWISIYSILLLDISGSIENKYAELLDMTKKIIENQMKNLKNKVKIIFFGSDDYDNIPDIRKITVDDVENIKVSRGSIFDKPFDLALKYINIPGNFNNKRLLFLTDGQVNSYNLQSKCDKIANDGFSFIYLVLGNLLDLRN